MTVMSSWLQAFTGDLLEKSLSADNIFVLALLFSYFAVPAADQHRVLFSRLEPRPEVRS